MPFIPLALNLDLDPQRQDRRGVLSTPAALLSTPDAPKQAKRPHQPTRALTVWKANGGRYPAATITPVFLLAWASLIGSPAFFQESNPPTMLQTLL